MSNKHSKSYLEINLSSLKFNYELIKAQLDTGSELAVVAKNNCYGLGFKAITSHLYQSNVTQFYVSRFKEAIELRKHIPPCTIFTINSLTKSELKEAFHQHIIPCLNTLEEAENYTLIAKEHNKKLPAILFVETGMGRSGFQFNEIENLLSNNLLSSIDIKYLVSHLACADTPGHRMNHLQLEKLQAFSQLFPNIKLSLANSAGVFLGKNFHFDQVRVGCALYGINPIPSRPSAFKQVAHLYGKVLFVRTLEEDQSVSYGARAMATKGSKIATIEFGYANGYHRILTGNTQAYYAGHFLPIIGTINMDMMMADVSAVPEYLLAEMTHVELMGDNYTVDDIAGRAQTIGYEILTSIGNKFDDIIIRNE